MAAEVPDFAPCRRDAAPGLPDPPAGGTAVRRRVARPRRVRGLDAELPRDLVGACRCATRSVFLTDRTRPWSSAARTSTPPRAPLAGLRTDWPLLQQIEVRDGLILTLQPFHWDTAAILSALAGSG